MEYKAQVMKKHKEVVLKVCRDAKLQEEDLKELLPRLIPMLLSDMAYEDNDESLLDAEDDESQADKDPGHDDDSFNVWNLRKWGEKTIHIFSNVFGDEIALTLMPLIETKLSRSDDETWKEREAIVFALGTVAEGCINCFYPHLSKLVAILLPLLDDKFPLIRSISCWTLSRYGIYLLNESDHKSYEQFENILVGLLCKLLDKNKRVQKAACLAFTTFVKDAGEDLVPHLGVILQHIICAFGTNQRPNIGIVYDAIRTLGKLVGEELNKPAYLEIMIPPLVAKWQQLSNSDKDIYLMLQCFTSISQALGARFIPFARPVFQRCIKIIQMQQLAKVGLASAGAQYDKESIVHSLDFLYDLAEGLGSGIESLVSHSILRDMLIKYCMDKASDVRERAFALMGVLARVFPVYLQPHLYEFLDIARHQLSANVIRENVNVATNACWAIGELALKVRQKVSPIVTDVVSSVGLILQHGEWDKALVENSAITLGRLAWICPDLVAPQMEHYLEPWCMSFSMIYDDIKKEETFRGLCAVVKVNPLGVGSSLFFICQAIASWHPSYLEILMSPLVAKLQQLSISDKDIFPLLKSFGSISQALGVRFAPFAQPVFQRCMDIIQIQQLAKVGLAPAGAHEYEKEFIIRSLDFLYDLAGGLKGGIESLVSHSILRDMLIKYCMDKASDVRERAFALMGVLARVFPVYLQPRLLEFLEIASQQLSENVIRENLYVTTNACWAIGELAVKVRQEVSPIVDNVVSSLGRILQRREGVNKALVENSAITLGRLAWIRPDIVAPHMEHFVEPWCMTLSMLYDGIKKEDAFRGLSAMVKVNPLGVANSFYYICQAIASWHEIRSQDVWNDVSHVLNVYKYMLGRNSWEEWLSFLDPLVKERLARY